MLVGVELLQDLLAGRYELERELGRGGTAAVYLAHDLRHARRVAIKVLRPELAAGIGADRFRSEIEIAASLAHPGILPVFDSGGAGELLYYVMPYIEGESLRALLDRERRLPVAAVLRIVRDVGEALAYAHARGIVHRDIKPENVLLVAGRAVIADFGIARALARVGAEDRLTTPGLALGTPLYMSPEQASGSEIDGRSDVYSLACVMYEMLAGVAPHAADTPRAIIARKLSPQAYPAPLDRTDVPRHVERALFTALASDPDERFRTASEFVAAITPREGVLRRTSGWIAPRLETFGRRRLALLGASTVAALLLVAASALWWRRAHPPLVSDDGRMGVAVLPFRPTVTSAAELAEAIPDLLATALDGTPGVRVVDPWSLWRTLRPDSKAPPRAPDPDQAARLAARANARCFVLGSIARIGDRVELSLRLYRLGRDEPWQTISAAGPSDSLSSLVQGLAVELIRRLASGPTPASLARFDRGLTRNPEALKAWLAARELRRRGQVDSADAAITRAISLDSTFVLAMVDALSIRSWAQYQRGEAYSGLLPLARRAVALGDSLPERARLRAAAMLASIETDGPRAAGALTRIIALDSADVDAWSLLAYVSTVYGWQYGQTDRDAIAIAEQAIRLDPTDATALARRLYLAAAVNDSLDLERQLRRLSRADTTAAFMRGALRSVQAAGASDAGFRDLLARLADAPASEWLPAQRILRVYRPDRAELLAARVRESPAPQSQRVGLGGLVQIWSAESRWRAIDSLRRANAFAVVLGFDRLVDRLTTAAAIAGVADDSVGARAAASLAAGMIPDSAQAWFAQRPVWHEGWLIGAYHAMYGDTSLARRWAVALGALPSGGSPAEYNAALRADLESRLAARRGDRSTALAEAGRALRLWTVHTENQLELMPEPAMRFHLASLLRAAGQTDSAATLFRSLVPPTTWMGFYTARASLELAELLEARGDPSASRHFLTAFRLWERGDSSVATLRARARRGVERDTP